MEEKMHPRTKGSRSDAGGYMPSDALADLLDDNSEPVTPEEAAEKAADRIIRALRKARGREASKNGR